MFDRLFRSLSPNLSPHIQMFARSLCPARGCSGTPSPLVLGPLRCSHSNISCGGQAFPIGRSSAATAFGCCHSGGWPLHQFLRPPALSMDGALRSLALGCSSAWCSPVLASLVLKCSSARPVPLRTLAAPSLEWSDPPLLRHWVSPALSLCVCFRVCVFQAPLAWSLWRSVPLTLGCSGARPVPRLVAPALLNGRSPSRSATLTFCAALACWHFGVVGLHRKLLSGDASLQCSGISGARPSLALAHSASIASQKLGDGPYPSI